MSNEEFIGSEKLPDGEVFSALVEGMFDMHAKTCKNNHGSSRDAVLCAMTTTLANIAGYAHERLLHAAGVKFGENDMMTDRADLAKAIKVVGEIGAVFVIAYTEFVRNIYRVKDADTESERLSREQAAADFMVGMNRHSGAIAAEMIAGIYGP